ncbi:conjugal transfer protein [Streptomyces sp. NPDC012637]|uniref:conjugal transfer protein n=1 Tax=Streptomyces sp. NPDC012637 TaxID=3364842 RepID=UPI0036F0B76B
MNVAGKPLSGIQKIVLGLAFVPMLATGGAGAYGTYTNIKAAYGSGTAVGAVAAGEGATAVLAVVLLGLTLLGQSAPVVIRVGLWALPAAASAMSAMAAKTPGEMVIYALTPLGMTASAEGAAFLARRIVVYRDGRDAEAERRAAEVVQALAYHRARAANHPDEKVRRKSDLTSWKLAKRVGSGDLALGERLLDVQRTQLTDGANAALAAMYAIAPAPTAPASKAGSVDEPGPVTVELEVNRSTRPIHPANADESTQTSMERSTSEQAVPALESGPADRGQDDLFEPEESTPPNPEDGEEAARRRVLQTLGLDQPPRKTVTRRVPEAAKSTQPRRSKGELLAEARQFTESWPIEHLTADRIRKELRTSPASGRWLRDTLKAERAA